MHIRQPLRPAAAPPLLSLLPGNNYSPQRGQHPKFAPPAGIQSRTLTARVAKSLRRRCREFAAMSASGCALHIRRHRALVG